MAKGKKGGAGLAIIALLISVGSTGFTFYSWYTQPKVPLFWSEVDETIFIPPLLSYETVLFIEFELTSNHTLHLLYTGSSRILPNTISFADIIFKFKINDELLDEPFTRSGPYEGQSTYDYIPVTLQHVLENVGPGIYNISVQALTEEAGNHVRSNVFTITAYPL